VLSDAERDRPHRFSMRLEGAPVTRRLAFAATLVAATAMVGCGGDDDGVAIVDSGPIQTQCDPVAQTGCEDGEKCAQVVISEEASETTCLPNGTVALGEPCEYGDLGETTGFDDCEAGELGAQCINGVCREICEADSCTEGFACDFYENLFDDLDPTRVGVCNQECNPVTQDCSLEDEGCYLSVDNPTGQGSCTSVPEAISGIVQGDECAGPESQPDLCYSNGCGVGFHPLIIDDTPETQDDRSLCTAYCQPVDTHLNDVDADGTGDPKEPLFGNVLGFVDEDPKTPDISCSAERIGPAAHECRFFQAIVFGDIGAIDYIPAEYGFCVDSTIAFWGSCANYSEERIIVAFDTAEAEAPGSGGEGLTDFCEANAAACARFCLSVAKQEEVLDAYCAGPTPPRVDPSEACTRRSRFFQKRREWEQRGLKAAVTR
jgi:hypothetical protein